MENSDVQSGSVGSLTLWLSFERQSLRAFLLAATVICGTFIVLFVHLGLAWIPVGRFANGVVSFEPGGVSRYTTLITSSSAAAVAALIAPAAVSSFLARPREHGILTQLLRVSRGVVFVGSLPIYWAALTIALSVRVWEFVALIEFGLAYSAFALVLLIVAYRNCERMAKQPGVTARLSILLRTRRLRRAEAIQSKLSGKDEDDFSKGQLRRRMKAGYVMRLKGDGQIVPGSAMDESARGRIRNYLDHLALGGFREWKTPREMPFESLNESAVFTVRLIRANGPEAPLFLTVAPDEVSPEPVGA